MFSTKENPPSGTGNNDTVSPKEIWRYLGRNENLELINPPTPSEIAVYNDYVSWCSRQGHEEAEKAARIEAERALYQAIHARIKIERGNQNSESPSPLLSALNHFNEHPVLFFSKIPCKGLEKVSADEFQLIQEAFPSPAYKAVFAHYNVINQRNHRWYQQCRANYLAAMQGFKQYLQDHEEELGSPEDETIQARLFRQGKQIYFAMLQEVKEDSKLTAEKYCLLRNIIATTQVAIICPDSVNNMKSFYTHTKQANGSVSVGAILSGALAIFLGTLILAASVACSFLALISFDPLLFIASVPVGVIGGLSMHIGIETIKKEIKARPEKLPAKIGEACTSFYKEWEKKDRSHSSFMRFFKKSAKKDPVTVQVTPVAECKI